MNNVRLSIEITETKNLGTCYNATFYKIKSHNRPLSDSDVKALRDMGFLGYGQEFTFKRGPEEQQDSYNRFYVVIVEDRVDSSD